MSTPNQAQRDAWNGESGERWVADADRRDRVLAPVADALLAAAVLQRGESVLDLGCGCGVTTLAAADIVDPGRVVGVDLSVPMLALARERAGDRAITFLQADVQTHPFAGDPFDVAISRFGTMFFDDPVAAFSNVATAVRPGGRLCIATWQAISRNDWLRVPASVLLRYGDPPPGLDGDGPGMFAQADADAVRRVLTQAGWSDVDVAPVAIDMRVGADLTEALDYLTGSGAVRMVLDTIDPETRPEATAAVAEALAPYQTSDGVLLPGAINVVAATR